MSELKPCPFCGAIPRMDEYTDHSWGIECGNINCCGKSFVADKEFIINQWNTRVPSQPTPQEESAAEALLKDMWDYFKNDPPLWHGEVMAFPGELLAMLRYYASKHLAHLPNEETNG